MIYIVKIDNKEYEVEVEKGQANIVKTAAITDPKVIEPTVSAPTITSASAPATPAVSVAGEAIKAPMPGTIIDIKVNTGENVKKGDVLLVLEAMKMENELIAPVDGIVVQVLVVKGSSVATDDVLISIQ